MRKTRYLLVIFCIMLTSLLLTSTLDASLDDSNCLSVTFSPQSDLDGYLSELIKVINSTDEKLEIALYGFEDLDIFDALEDAVSRGVEIRILLESAHTDRLEEGTTLSSILEDIGIDVKYVNKTIHHKFMISDNIFLVTGSGNWNYDANSLYDENVLYTTDEELILRYRAEFELLWANSREYGTSFPFSVNNPTAESLLENLVDNPGRDAYFTSANYRIYISSTYGPTFAKKYQTQLVSDKIVELINQSTSSIYIAANHLRSLPISEALINKKIDNPDIDIKVYLDGQEFVSEGYNKYQTALREEKLEDASTPGEIYEIMQKNFYYSYELIKAGIDVRFKYYSYKWSPDTSALMHHKYAIFDNNIIATGSYNYSYNAETNSMENILVFDSTFSPDGVSDYINNFNDIWNTGRIEGYYNDLLSYINSDTRFIPVLFPAVSLDYTGITELKDLIEAKCPAVVEEYFSNNREYYSYFTRGLEYQYDERERISSITNNDGIDYTVNFTYNNYDQITGVSYNSADGLQFEKYYDYTQDGRLTQVNTPEFNLNFYYDEYLTMIDTGQGDYTWDTVDGDNGSTIRYSTPLYTNYLVYECDENNFPVNAVDSDNRNISFNYNSNYEIDSIVSGDRTIDYLLNDDDRNWQISSSNGESICYQQIDDNLITANISGTVMANLIYTFEEQEDRNTLLTIDIESDHVDSGYGKHRSIEYLYNPYGRVINANDLQITREPFSNNITSIQCNGIIESRTYNDWEQLTNQTVYYNNTIYYQAVYQYDSLGRIKKLTENVLDESNEFSYTYDYAGRLTDVFKNGVIIENYSYDAYGNRLTDISIENHENFLYNNINRLTEMSWALSDRLKKVEYTYNNSGQLLHSSYKTIKDGNQWVSRERNYDYDVFGNLNEVCWASQSQAYKYDPYDRQIACFQNGELTKSYIYGFGDKPLAELNENGRIINVFLYGDKYTPLVMQKASTPYYIISDIRGSVRLVVQTTTGDIRQQINYDSFGRILYDSNPGYNPFAFAGGLYDNRTELLRFGERDYSAETGRWTSEDPIAFLSGDINFYAYAGNDPINYIDPSGLSKTSGDINWKNGWRTKDGKFATPQGKGKPGAEAEKSVWEAISKKPGWRVIRGRVYTKNAAGQTRVYDGAARSPSGNNIGLEVKSGKATKTGYQRAFDKGVTRSNPAYGIGQNKGLMIKRTALFRIP